MFLWIQTEGAFQVALVLTTLPANSGDKSTCRLDLLIGKISWRIAWQPTSEFLPGKSHGREPGGLHSRGSQRDRQD